MFEVSEACDIMHSLVITANNGDTSMKEDIIPSFRH